MIPVESTPSPVIASPRGQLSAARIAAPRPPSHRSLIDVVVAGYLGVDLTPGFHAAPSPVRASDLFRPGTLIETKGLTVSLGGAVANTGLALKKFGRRVELMACISDDALGRTVTELLRAQGVRRGIRRIAGGTAYGIVIAPPHLNRIFFEDCGCNAHFTADHIDYDLVRRSRLFHFGYPPLMPRLWADGGAELHRMFARAQRLGVITSLDLALPDPLRPAGRADWRAILARVLPCVDIFVPSVEELLFMLEPETFARLQRRAGSDDMLDAIPEEAFARLADAAMAAGVKILMLKAGGRGAFIRTSDVAALQPVLGPSFPAAAWSQRSLWVRPFAVDRRRVHNASGAGDCAIAGFLSALLDGATLERAADYAMLAGRDNLYGNDARSGLRDWSTMTRIVKRTSAPVNGATAPRVSLNGHGKS